MTPRVLIVDDDADIREVMTLTLESRGYRVVTAADGVECLNLLRSGERPGLILLDLMMPRMDGWAVCAAIAREPSLAGLPIYVLTGNVRASENGLEAMGFLRKPIELTTLIQVVERHLGRAEKS